MPAISVIMPVYNSEKYLHSSITSVLRQTFTDIELILIDDGSTDSSGAICESFAAQDKRVVFIGRKTMAFAGRAIGLFVWPLANILL